VLADEAFQLLVNMSREAMKLPRSSDRVVGRARDQAARNNRQRRQPQGEPADPTPGREAWKPDPLAPGASVAVPLGYGQSPAGQDVSFQRRLRQWYAT